MAQVAIPDPGYVTVCCLSCGQTLWAPGRATFWCGREPPSEVFQHRCGDGNIRPDVRILMGVKGGAIQMPLLEEGERGPVDLGDGN